MVTEEQMMCCCDICNRFPVGRVCELRRCIFEVEYLDGAALYKTKKNSQ
jgi:hypothetical protein